MNLSQANRLGEQAFECRLGDDTLRGIVHVPATPLGIGLVLMPAGYKYRTGPHGFYVRLARVLARHGIHVLRADFRGLGYSDGELPQGMIQKLWQNVEDGCFSDDAAALADALRARFGLSHIAAGGICGGAITAQAAAAARPGSIDSLVEINAPVVRTRMPGKAAPKRTQEIEREKANYFRKFLSWSAWRRVLTGASDYGSIFRTLFSRTGKSEADSAPDVSVNPLFDSSFEQTNAHGTFKLMLFGGKDARWFDFADLYLATRLSGRESGNSWRVEIVPDANHEMFLEAWQADAVSRIDAFLHERAAGR
ncbi:MAG: alpha/beta fold hydrolase [Pseudomonadales bacterium]|nr:alpha/beta fold hydrolase [Pseudomonadales bacterium]